MLVMAALRHIFILLPSGQKRMCETEISVDHYKKWHQKKWRKQQKILTYIYLAMLTVTTEFSLTVSWHWGW